MKLVSPALLADMVIPGKNFGISSEKTGAGDAFVLMTLGFLFFLFGIFVFAAWRLWKRETRPDPHVKLLMELEEDEQARPNTEAGAPAGEQPEGEPKPWEQPADWWKKPG